MTNFLKQKNTENFLKQKNTEKFLAWLLIFGLGGAALLGFIGVFVVTLGYDEAWILLGIQNIIQPQQPGLAVDPVVTSGGIYAAAQLAITFFAGNAIWAHRLFTFLCFLVTGVLLTWWGCRWFGSTLAGLMVTAALLVVPGTLVFAATYATIPAFLCVLLAMTTWERTLKQRRIRWLLCGLLVGLAAATRFDCIVLLPAIILWSLLTQDRENFTDSLLVCVVAIIVFATGVTLLTHAAPPSTHVSLDQVRGSIGLESPQGFPYQRVLNKWIIAESDMPLFLMTLATLISWLLVRWTRQLGRMPTWTILIPFGWLLWAAWLALTPHAHLRYLWLGLAAFAVVIGLGLGRLYQWGQMTGRTEARLAALILAITCVVSGLGSGLRNLLYGEGNTLSFEWERTAPVDLFGSFASVQNQLAAARYLRSHSTPNEIIGVFGLEEFEIRYLSNRQLVPLSNFSSSNQWKTHQLPRRLMLSPMVGTAIYLPPAGYRWIEENCSLEAQFGGYSFYRVTGTYPKNPAPLIELSSEVRSTHPLSKHWLWH